MTSLRSEEVEAEDSQCQTAELDKVVGKAYGILALTFSTRAKEYFQLLPASGLAPAKIGACPWTSLESHIRVVICRKHCCFILAILTYRGDLGKMST